MLSAAPPIVPPATRDLTPAIVLGVVAGVIVIPQALLLAHVINAFFLGGAALTTLTTPLVLLASLSVVRAALTWAADVKASGVATQLKRSMRASLAARVLAAGPQWLDRGRTGGLVGTLGSGVDALDAYVGSYKPQVVLAVVIPLAVLVTVALIDPLSALVLLVTGPLIPLFMWLLGGIARDRTTRQWRDLLRLSARFLDAIQGLVTLQAFGRVDAEAQALGAASDRFRMLTMRVLRVAFLSSLALELLATLGTAIVAVQVGLRLLYDWITFEEALGVLLLAPEFYRPLRTLGASFHAGMAGRETMRQVAQLEQSLPSVEAPLIESAPAPPITAAPALTFDRVVVRYTTEQLRALDECSFSVDSGELVGITGRSGAGKSTLLALLLRFRRLESGAILVDDRPLDAWTPEVWRAGLAWAPQRPHLFHGTVLDNLRLGMPTAGRTAIAEALRLSAFDDVVARLPRGLDTPVGERGMRLSGGEAQRLSLARAYLKEAPLLLLDEPTSDLDSDTEARVVHGLMVARHGRTTLLVSHRATTLRAADRVVTLQQEQVAP